MDVMKEERASEESGRQPVADWKRQRIPTLLLNCHAMRPIRGIQLSPGMESPIDGAQLRRGRRALR